MSGTALALTIYVLMWPVIVAAVLIVIVVAFTRETLESRRRGEKVI